MDVKKLQARNTSLDIIRVVAVFSVLSVHFFLHNEFYFQTVEGAPMFIATIMRTLFTVCVPLFMILTGYLMSHKELSGAYYKGLRKTLIVYAIAFAVCFFARAIRNGYEITGKDFFFNFLNFEAVDGHYSWYSWYIEMYIGLFLIAPFLNLAYKGLKTQKGKQILVLTFFALAVLPSLTNIFNFDTASWWANPKSNETYANILPNYWIGLYPLAYYFTGAYIREYGIKLKTRTLLIGYAAVWFLFSVFNYYRNYGGTFSYGAILNWNTFEAYVLSVGLFVILSRIKCDKMPNAIKYAFWKISDLALGIYLFSYVFDYIIYYSFLNKYVTDFGTRLWYYFIVVPIGFVLAACASFLANLLAKGIIALYEEIKKSVKRMYAQNKQLLLQNIIFFALLGGAVIFSMWKCFYGFGGYDESFYLTVPHRLSQGDAMFTQEWHLSQMAGFLLYPFVSLFTAITGSTEGIMLAARFVYVIGHAAVAGFVYYRLRKYGYVTVFGVLLYYIFTPYDIMAYSYNTMALDLIALTGVLMATANYSKKLPLIFGGLCFAGAVLCSPYLAIAYVLFAVCVGIHYIVKKKTDKFVLSTDLFSGKTFLWFTVGVAILAVLFLIFVLTRVGFGDIFNVLPKLLSDPEHPQISIWQRLGFYFSTAFNYHPHFCLAFYAYGALLLAMIIDRKRSVHRALYFILSVMITAFCYILIVQNLTTTGYNALMMPALFVGITSYILCKNKPRKLFASLFVLGICYSFAVCFASNQYFYVEAMAMSVVNIASFVFAAQLLRELRETDDNFDYALLMRRTAFVAMAFMIIVQGGMEISCKADHCFWEGEMSTLTTEIPNGPAKGIITTPERVTDYNNTAADLKRLENESSDKKVLVLSIKTWSYLQLSNKRYATYSAWIGDENYVSIEQVFARLNSYYETNPDKRPDFVYVPFNTKWDQNTIAGTLATWGMAKEQLTYGYMYRKQ